jgi:hypothetical protein
MRFAAAMAALAISAAAAAQSASLPRKAIEDTLRDTPECSVPIEEASEAPQSFDLGAGQKLFIVKCWAAAYQFGYMALVMDQAGDVRQMTFQDWDGKRYRPMTYLAGADFDPASKTMNSFFKGRGLGDCGSLGSWQWTGSVFKLKAYYYKAECDGKSFARERRWRIFPRR